MHTSVRTSAPRLAHRRALVPIGTRGLVLSRIDYLIPNRLSYPESIIVSRVWGGRGGDREAGGEGGEEEGVTSEVKNATP